MARWVHASTPFALSASANGSMNPALAHLAKRRRILLCATLPTRTLQQKCKWCRSLPSTIGSEGTMVFGFGCGDAGGCRSARSVHCLRCVPHCSAPPPRRLSAVCLIASVLVSFHAATTGATTIQMATSSATRAAAPSMSRACLTQSKPTHVASLTGQTQARRRLTGSVQSVCLFMQYHRVHHRWPRRARARRHRVPRPHERVKHA